MRASSYAAIPMTLLAVAAVFGGLATPAVATNPPVPVFRTEVSKRAETNFTIQRLKKLVEDSVQTLLTIAVVIVTGFVVYGGMQMAMAADDTKKFEAGKKTVITAIIGGAIILGVGIIINTIVKASREPGSVIN